MIPKTIPKWLADLPGDANLNSRDIASIFKYSTNGGGSLVNAQKAGKIPVYAQKIKSGTDNHYICLWKVSTVRNFIRRANRDSGDDTIKT